MTFRPDPLAEDTEITGPLAATLHMSSPTADADLFAVFQVFAPQGKEVVFQGALGPPTPIGQGWLRLSHRERDEHKSRPWRPYYVHTRSMPLAPREVVAVDVEIWPTCLVVPAGHRIGVTVRRKDNEWNGPPARLADMKNPLEACGPFLHDDPDNRPAQVHAGFATLHFGAEAPSRLLLPVIPAR